jgi:hypothetical protein
MIFAGLGDLFYKMDFVILCWFSCITSGLFIMGLMGAGVAYFIEKMDSF